MSINFGHGKKVIDRALQITDQDMDIVSASSFSLLKIQHDFKDKTFDELPERIHQLADVCDSIQKHIQSGQRIGVGETDFLPIAGFTQFRFC